MPTFTERENRIFECFVFRANSEYYFNSFRTTSYRNLPTLEQVTDIFNKLNQKLSLNNEQLRIFFMIMGRTISRNIFDDIRAAYPQDNFQNMEVSNLFSKLWDARREFFNDL